MRLSLLTVILTASTLGAAPAQTDNTVTWLGWFSDKSCAEAKVNNPESVTPNGTACVKRCLEEGATPVFVNPKARALYEVKDHPSLKEDVGYYLELTGVVDEKAKTISVRSVKRLGDVIQMCARPPKT
jgi:hypothetical protein